MHRPNNIKTEDDPWLIKSFEVFEKMPVTKKEQIDWSLDLGFQVFSEYLVNDLREIQVKLKDADDEYLYYVCRRVFNILDWIKLIVIDAGFPTFDDAFESLFEKQFRDKYILQSIYDVCFEKWISHKSGQQKIGENFYNLLEGNLYYRNRFGQWFEVDKKTAFDLQPSKERVNDQDKSIQLNKDYKVTWYDEIINHWNSKNYQGQLPDDFMQFQNKETSPEEYAQFTLGYIKNLLSNPISIAELELWNGGQILDLEDIVKISALVLDIVKKRRKDGGQTLYLLRDCLIFYEAQKALDILNSEETSVDQLLIGRKLLSHKLREWGYYVLTLESLYSAHKNYSTNFDEFYRDYTRLLDVFVSLNSGFAKLIADLANYIKQHIQLDQNKITIFDIGFQGSIALLTKYIIDHHINLTGQNGKIKTDLQIGVAAIWSKDLFGDRYIGDYFPFLNRVQLLARSNDLYHYKLDSLDSGKLRVIMGEEDKQRRATAELITIVMVAMLAHTEGKK